MTTQEDIIEQIQALPQEQKDKFLTAMAAVIRCFLKEDAAVLIHLRKEDKLELTTTGINATYEDSFHMVQASYGMFMDTFKEMENAKENLQ